MPASPTMSASSTISDNNPGDIDVEVAYGLPTEQALLAVVVPEGSTVADAIQHSGILQRFPEIDLSVNAVGVWNRSCKLQHVLRAGDRIEIYRPLIADPKQVRRLRAEKAKQEGRASKVTGGRPSR